VQRTGPSTGMPTRTQQSDILECAYASHGDTKHLLLFPGNPFECFELAARSFDLAERFQTPVMMLSDLDVGMNDWVVPKLTWNDAYIPDRGIVLDADMLERLQKFHRYSRLDSDFVAARTLPGVSPFGAYFARGSGHTEDGFYTESPDEYQRVVDRLLQKHAAAARHMPEPIIEEHPGARIGLVTVGGCDLAVREAMHELEQLGVTTDYMRVRGFPFRRSVEAFLNAHERIFVIEQNRDAQLRTLLTLETNVPKSKLRSVLSYGGYPLSAETVVASVQEQMGE